MPRGAAPRALLGVFALIVAVAVAIVPVVDARPKDKNGGKQDAVAEETTPADEPVKAEAAPATEPAPVVEQALTANEGVASNDRTLLQLDADGDYIPDALDNCPGIQNPDQADADGDGHGDACPVYVDTDGDTVPDKQDNCPSAATSDFSDSDGDGVGDPCDKSPDGIEPESEPAPDLDGQRGDGEAEPLAPENGSGQNGDALERDGGSPSRQRTRTDSPEPVITTGSHGESEGVGGPPAQEETPVEEPVRDNPRINEELIAEAAASGELYAPPEPPPVATRIWDEEAAGTEKWESIVRIDAGAGNDAAPGNPDADDEPNDAGRENARDGGDGRPSRDAADAEAGDSEFARGWVRAKLLLQDELEGDDADAGDGGGREDSAPVPVENGLVIDASTRDDEAPRDRERDAASDDAADEQASLDDVEPQDEAEPLDEASGPPNDRQDGSRRDGPSRSAAAAPERQQANAETDTSRERNDNNTRRERQTRGNGGMPQDWSDDRYFEGGSALNWSGDIGVAGTDDDGLYLTQRSGSGPGKRRGFDYAIPVDENGVYMVRLYFAEPYWGAPGGPEGDVERRVFTVTGEGETLLEDLDVFAEAGSLTALVKQVEVDVQDGELNLRFTASEGEPIVAAIEILQPAT